MSRNKTRAISAFVGALIIVCLALVVVFKYSGVRELLLRKEVQSGNVLGVNLLISLGANVNAKFNDDADSTVLFYAASYAHPEVVRILLRAGADPNVTDSCLHATPLCYSLTSGLSDSIQVDNLLIDAGGLGELKGGFPYKWMEKGVTAALHVRVLLDHGADPNLAASDGTTPLMFFAARGDIDAIALLLEHGARINATAPDGRTALSEAVTQGYSPETVEYLIRHGADATRKLNGKNMVEIARYQREDYIKSGCSAMGPLYDRIIRCLYSAYGLKTRQSQEIPNVN